MTSGERSQKPRTTGRWRNGTTPVIGLTGGVASGKSAVAALLVEHGCAAITSDFPIGKGPNLDEGTGRLVRTELDKLPDLAH